jgi:hypothetical protein
MSLGVMIVELDLPLTVVVPCWASSGARSVRHPVRIEADWSVHAGHYPDLERIAVAFGGGVSCLPMLAEAIPGLRQWWERARRASGLMIRSPDRGATWHAGDSVHTCCPDRGFPDPAQAAAHVRSPTHVASHTGAPRRELRGLVAGVTAGDDPRLPIDPRLGALGSDRVAAAAWECGLQPAWVARVRGILAATGSLEGPVAVLLAIAQTGAEPTWIAETTARSVAGSSDVVDPEARVATSVWLAWTWTDLDLRMPEARSAWVATGARRSDIVALSQAHYQAEDANAVARDWRISPAGAAAVLARWVGSGYAPSPAQLRCIRDSGVTFPQHPPARSAVERIASEMARDWRGSPASRGADVAALTALAVALASCGTVRDTVVALRRGGDVGPPD